jgi:hypothetical protein
LGASGSLCGRSRNTGGTGCFVTKDCYCSVIVRGLVSSSAASIAGLCDDSTSTLASVESTAAGLTLGVLRAGSSNELGASRNRGLGSGSWKRH